MTNAGRRSERSAPYISDAAADEPSFKQLAPYRHCLARMQAAWPEFASRRRERLQQGLFDAPVEKIAENIVEDLFTTVLDWSLSDVNLQVGRADVVLSGLGIKRLVVTDCHKTLIGVTARVCERFSRWRSMSAEQSCAPPLPAPRAARARRSEG